MTAVLVNHCRRIILSAIIKSQKNSARKENGNQRMFLFGAHCYWYIKTHVAIVEAQEPRALRVRLVAFINAWRSKAFGSAEPSGWSSVGGAVEFGAAEFRDGPPTEFPSRVAR